MKFKYKNFGVIYENVDFNCFYGFLMFGVFRRRVSNSKSSSRLWYNNGIKYYVNKKFRRCGISDKCFIKFVVLILCIL